MQEQKLNMPLVLLAVAILAGSWFVTSNEVPGPDIIGIAKIAADDTATFANTLGMNADELASMIDAGKFKTTDAVHAEWVKMNAKSRQESFAPWGAAIQPAIEKQDFAELSALLRESAKGFKAAVRE